MIVCMKMPTRDGARGPVGISKVTYTTGQLEELKQPVHVRGSACTQASNQSYMQHTVQSVAIGPTSLESQFGIVRSGLMQSSIPCLLSGNLSRMCVMTSSLSAAPVAATAAAAFARLRAAACCLLGTECASARCAVRHSRASSSAKLRQALGVLVSMPVRCPPAARKHVVVSEDGCSERGGEEAHLCGST